MSSSIHLNRALTYHDPVTSRTTSLTNIHHANFSLRFSDLSDIETVCKEDEEQRAARSIDWINSRVSKQCSKWVEDVEKYEDSGANEEWPEGSWWEEVRRCSEGDQAPAKHEGWNHPVASMSPVLPSDI